MKPPKCSYCSVSEWRHVCGGNKFSNFIRNASPKEKAAVYGEVMERATNRQVATNRTATNSATNKLGEVVAGDVPGNRAEESKVDGALDVQPPIAGGKDVVAKVVREEPLSAPRSRQDKTGNRRSRESYNAYQREYMRRIRCKARPTK